MARIQFPHRSSVLTASFSVRQPPNAPVVLSCPPTAPHLPCGCRRRIQDFSLLRPDLDPPEIVVLFLCPERAFHRSYPHSGKLLSDKVFLLFLLTERTASFHERCLYSVRLAVVPVFGSRVASISSDLFRVAPKQFLVHLQAVHQPGPFIERIERQLLNERYPVDQYVVELRTELDALHLLAPHYRSQMWLAETHYPVGDAFPAVIVPEVVLLLAVHPRDDFQITFLSDSQQVLCIPMAPLNLTYLLQYLAEQVKELCPETVKSQSAAQLTGSGCCRSSVPAVSDN